VYITENIYEFVINIISDASSLGLILSSLLIVVESIIPPLPLGFFVTILFVNYGPVFGFLISWFFTIIGCIISYYLFQNLFKNIVDKYIRKHEKANKVINAIENISFVNLVLIICIPFTPAFLVNIAAGISRMSINKFVPAIIIGKITLILFWGIVGSNIVESLINPYKLIIVILLILFTYSLSKVVNKKLKID